MKIHRWDRGITFLRTIFQVHWHIFQKQNVWPHTMKRRGTRQDRRFIVDCSLKLLRIPTFFLWFCNSNNNDKDENENCDDDETNEQDSFQWCSAVPPWPRLAGAAERQVQKLFTDVTFKQFSGLLSWGSSGQEESDGQILYPHVLLRILGHHTKSSWCCTFCCAQNTCGVFSLFAWSGCFTRWPAKNWWKKLQHLSSLSDLLSVFVPGQR